MDLASFSIAFKILGLFTGAVEDFKYVSIVLVHCPKDRLKVLLACGAFAVVALVVMLVVGSCFSLFLYFGCCFIHRLFDLGICLFYHFKNYFHRLSSPKINACKSRNHPIKFCPTSF